jgi:hypothetical protein
LQEKASGVTPAGFFSALARLLGASISMTRVEQIVEEHVRLGDRNALEFLLTHRRSLSADLKGRSDCDLSIYIGQIDDVIIAIEAGLLRLKTRPVRLPHTTGRRRRPHGAQKRTQNLAP